MKDKDLYTYRINSVNKNIFPIKVDVWPQVKKESPSLFIISFTGRWPQPQTPQSFRLPECACVLFAFVFADKR